MGRDGKTVVKMEPWSCPVPSRRQFHLPLTRTVPSRQEHFSPSLYRPVPSTKPAPTVPSRRQNQPIPSRAAVKTCPDHPTPPFIAVTPSRQETVNTNYD